MAQQGIIVIFNKEKDRKNKEKVEKMWENVRERERERGKKKKKTEMG